MKKLIPLIILAPFIIVTFYYGLDKYMCWMFGKNEGEQFVSIMLTTIVTVVVPIFLIVKEIDL